MATQREMFSLGASIGNFWFMHFGLSHHSQYQQLIRLFTSTPFSGPSNDLRNVIGITASYGADAIPESEAIGHVLFGDQDRVLPEHQVVGNILDLIPSLPKTADSEQVCTNALESRYPEAESLLTGAQTGIMRPGKLVLEPSVCGPGIHKTIHWNSAEKLVEPWQRVAERMKMAKAAVHLDSHRVAQR
ncbi:hypothetical protein EAE99_001014 [Botrytis elliptica]|nr:hypothetical protein EAE99_001014 [Botrytis elliptica]